MKNYKNIGRQVCTFLGLITLFSWTSVSDNNEKIKPLNDYVTTNKLSVTVLSLGGHSENCVELTIKNKGLKAITSFLEPGRRLVSFDSAEQDIFIVKKKSFTVPPLAQVTIKGYGFCCQSSNHSPKKGSGFSVGYIAPEEWIALADTIDHNNFSSSAIQSAVWSLSDGHNIASIHGEDREQTLPLIRTVAAIRNITLPWYSYTYVNDSTRLFSGEPAQIHGRFDYFLKNNAAVSIVVKNEKGRLMQHLEKGHIYGHGKQSFTVDFKVKHWPKGEYEIIVVEDFWNINSVKKFVI